MQKACLDLKYLVENYNILSGMEEREMLLSLSCKLIDESKRIAQR